MMSENNYKRKYEFQQKMITRQSEQIEALKLQNEKLKLEIAEKEQAINSVGYLREELTQNIADIKQYKEKYKRLIQDLRDMKKILNQEVYKGRWWLVRFLIK
jgi:DNA anti-recombination protein RmuC